MHLHHETEENTPPWSEKSGYKMLGVILLRQRLRWGPKHNISVYVTEKPSE